MLRDTAGTEGDAQIHFLYCGLFNPSVLWTPPLYFVFQNTPQCYGARQGRRTEMSRNTIEYEREGGAPLFLTALFLAELV